MKIGFSRFITVLLGCIVFCSLISDEYSSKRNKVFDRIEYVKRPLDIKVQDSIPWGKWKSVDLILAPIGTMSLKEAKKFRFYAIFSG